MKFEDLTGRRFADLLVLRRDAESKKTKWICKCCLCGKEVSVYAYNLKNGNTKNCGCKSRRETAARSRKDLTGQTFGSAKVLRLSGSDKNGHAVFECECLACGTVFECLGTSLIQGRQISCGCKAKAKRAEGRTKTLQEAANFGTNVGKIRATDPNANNTTTHIKGVCFIKSTGMYVAYIGFQGQRYGLCQSPDIKKCIAAREEAEEHIYGDFLKWYDEHHKNEEEEPT